MRNLVIWFLLLTFCAFTCISCADSKIIDGKFVEPYGLLNQDEKNPDIHYRIVQGNVIWSVILCETLVMPVYFVGFSLYEPVKKLDN